jgi:hypothetical protein
MVGIFHNFGKLLFFMGISFPATKFFNTYILYLFNTNAFSSHICYLLKPDKTIKKADEIKMTFMFFIGKPKLNFNVKKNC